MESYQDMIIDFIYNYIIANYLSGYDFLISTGRYGR